jgi:hypothetical protein
MPISNWASFNLIGTRGSDSASKWQFHRREEFSGAPSFFFLSFFLILDKKFLLAVSRWFCCFCAVFEGYFGNGVWRWFYGGVTVVECSIATPIVGE